MYTREMFLLRTEKEFIDCFRPVDQRTLELPKGIRFPLVIRDYFAWSESSGARTYLIFSEPEVNKPIGISFDREHSSGHTAALCDWCHSMGSTNQIGLLTIATSSKRRVGVNLCLDLSCKEKIHSEVSLSSTAAQLRVRRVVERMSRFVRRTVI